VRCTQQQQQQQAACGQPQQRTQVVAARRAADATPAAAGLRPQQRPSPCDQRSALTAGSKHSTRRRALEKGAASRGWAGGDADGPQNSR
jgi:hypothetical protein